VSEAEERERAELEKLSKGELIDLVIDLRRVLVETRCVLDETRAALRAMEERVRRLEGGRKPGKRPPPKGCGPGRKPGQGPFLRRAAPAPGSITATVDVPLESTACPGCGAALEVTIEEASVTDVPAAPRPLVTLYRRQVGRCPACGTVVRAAHPALGPGHHGACAHQSGPGLKALALTLHLQCGLPLRRVPGALKTLCGASLTQGALTRVELTLAAGAAAPVYQGLLERLRGQRVVNTDDTGWRVGGKGAHLMGFCSKDTVVYQIRPRHRNEEVREVIGDDFAGILGTDRGKSYDARELDAVAQQKCLSHLIRNLKEVEEAKTGRAVVFSREVKECLQEALALWWRHKRGEMEPAGYLREGGEVEDRLTVLLRPRGMRDEDNQRLQNGIGAQHDRGRVLLFLRDPAVEPTNNVAERMLRPAVIARKVSQCSKNEAGASAYARLKSLAVTWGLRGLDVAGQFLALLSPEPAPAQ
jgi:transposase